MQRNEVTPVAWHVLDVAEVPIPARSTVAGLAREVRPKDASALLRRFGPRSQESGGELLDRRSRAGGRLQKLIHETYQ